MSATLGARAVTAVLSLAAFGFDPSQRRGPDGRWIRMGGGGGLPGGGGAVPDAVSEEDDELYRELRSEYGWSLHQAASDILRATREQGEAEPDPRWLEADPRWEPGDADPVLEKLARNLEWDLEDQPELADAAMELLLDHIKAEYPESVANLPEPPQRGALPQLHPRADASDGFGGARATRADALTAALGSGVAAQKPLSAGFMGDTRLLTLNDGSQVVYKRAISTLRPGDLNWEVKDQTDAEHLSSLLAGAVGAPAPVVHRLNDTELAMELVSGRPADASALTDARRRDILATDDAVRIGLLDVLLNNTDRHGGNWMVDDIGGPVAIDHGMAFAVNPPAGMSGATESPFATEHFINPDGTFRATNGLMPSDVARLEEEVERIRPQFERAGRADWLDAALGRLRQLGERARGPARPAVTAGDAGGLGLRARAATAMLELAFNPHQRRDSKGRWVKLADSELKRPRRRATQRPALRGQLSAWLDLPTGDMSAVATAELARMFGMEDPATGLRAEVTRGHVQNGKQISVWVDIRDRNGRRVGSAARILGVDPATGERWVDHTNFNLDKAARNGGFSSRWLAQMEDRYREAGIDRITLNTANVGGYAWAKAGFDFDSAEAAEDQANMVRHKLTQRGLMTPELAAQLDDMDRRIVSGNEDERPTPMEMAMLGWTPGAATWPGKTAMLGTYWSGVKKL